MVTIALIYIVYKQSLLDFGCILLYISIAAEYNTTSSMCHKVLF